MYDQVRILSADHAGNSTVTFYCHHKHKLDVAEIQVIIVAIQAKPVEIQVNVVQLHLSSEEIHFSKYYIQGFERVPQVSVGWKAPDLHISKKVAKQRSKP